MTRTFLTPQEILDTVTPFVNGRTGLMAPAFELFKPNGNPDVIVYSSIVSNATDLMEQIDMPIRRSEISGAGSSTTRQIAMTKSYCEGLERYCNVVYDPSSVIVATRDELGDEAVDLTTFASGTPEEYNFVHPRNIFVPPSNSAPIRWVRGFSLITGKPAYVPFMSVYISTPYQYPGESFIVPISTGNALAASYEQALVSGICEVIERDALMITWLQELPLPRIDVSGITNPEFWDRQKRVENAGIEQIFYDATLDLGAPTIYALQFSPGDAVAVIVMASTKLDPIQAMIRVMDEAAPSRIAIGRWHDIEHSFDPNDFHSFGHLEDGAVYYADPSHKHDFDFLLNHNNTCVASDIPSIDTGDVHQNLSNLIDIFRRNNLDLYAVDLTLPTMRDVGLYSIKVVAPQLIPLAISYNMRYTAAPRLYDVPARMNYPVKAASELNPNPQPFA